MLRQSAGQMEKMMMILSTVYFFVFIQVITCVQYTDRGRLQEDLFRNYIPQNRPVLSTDTKTQLNVSFYLRMVHQLDERHQKFVTAGWFSFEWRDELLTWEPNQYGNITSIITSGFWKPDVVIYNGYNDFHDLRTSTVDGILQFDGSILWAPASTFETHCPVDITFYPFDKQTCSLHIMSWTYTAKDLDLVTTQQSVDTQNYITNVEWEIERTSAEQVVLIYDAYDGDYPTLFFNITLARRRIFFLMNVLIPAISESLLCNLVFLVPSESGERMSLAITVLLSYAVFLGVTMESLPRSSVNVSIMTLYMLVVLMLGTLSVLLTGFSLYIYHLPEPVRAFRRRHAVLENDPKENEVADLNKDQPNRNGYVNADPEIHRFVPEERVLYDAKEQSRQFDRICLKLILSLTIISVACLLIALTWHDY